MTSRIQSIRMNTAKDEKLIFVRVHHIAEKQNFSKKPESFRSFLNIYPWKHRYNVSPIRIRILSLCRHPHPSPSSPFRGKFHNYRKCPNYVRIFCEREKEIFRSIYKRNDEILIISYRCSLSCAIEIIKFSK